MTKRILFVVLLGGVRAQPSPPPAPPVPDDSNAFGCWFYLPRMCDRGRDAHRVVGWNYDTWGMSNSAADSAYRCEHARPEQYNDYCYIDSPGVTAHFRFQSGVLNSGYAISSNLLLTDNKTAIVDGYDVTAVDYVNASSYPQSGSLLVRSNTMTVANVDVGGYIRDHGTISVDDGATLHVTEDLVLGKHGQGELRQQGGTILVDSALYASNQSTSTSLVRQSGGTMTVSTLNLGTWSSHAHLLVGGTTTVGYLTLLDDYHLYSIGAHKTRIVVGTGGVLTITEKLQIQNVHEQIELRGGQLVVNRFWSTLVETDLTKRFLTMYRDSSLLIYTSVPTDSNPCDTDGNLGLWYEQRFLDPAYTDQANKNLRPVLGEDSGSYEIRTRCTVRADSATGYAMEAYVYAIPSPPAIPPPSAPPTPPLPRAPQLCADSSDTTIYVELTHPDPWIGLHGSQYHRWIDNKWMCYNGDPSRPNNNQYGGCAAGAGYGLWHWTFNGNVNVPVAHTYIHRWWTGVNVDLNSVVHVIPECDTCPGTDWPLGECWYDPTGSGKLYTLTQYTKP